MQKLQDSVFTLAKTTNLSPAVFDFLQPTEDSTDHTPLGGILSNTKLAWLALGPKFCVVDVKTGLKVAAHTFGAALSNYNTYVTSVVELPTPLTHNTIQLVISLECEDVAGIICVFHINGSQILRCIQTDMVITELAIADEMPNGPFMCFDGVIVAGARSGEIIALDLNRASLVQALKDISQGNENLARSEINAAYITFLPLNAVQKIHQQRELALENDDHLAIVLNEYSLVDKQYIFRNPDGTVRMKAKRDHIRVSALQYIPQLGSVVTGFNFGAFQIWNLMTLDLEFTSQVNVECMPVSHFGFQEPCDDPRAFCYLWVIFSVTNRFEEEEFPLAVMYSLTYQGKRMLSDTKYLYQAFSTATIRFQIELGSVNDADNSVGGRCISCHTYSVSSTLGEEGEDNMLNLCHLVWECWGETSNSSLSYGMLLFDLDQWYKDQMPARSALGGSAFASVSGAASSGGARALHARPRPALPFAHAARREEHFYPNSLQYDVVVLNTSEVSVLSTMGIQRQILCSLDEVGPTALLNPTRLYNACLAAGLTPMYVDTYPNPSLEEQRRFVLSVSVEGRLSRLAARAAHDWASGAHAGSNCTLDFLVDWCWQRALELKENAKELIAPLFVSSALPDRNMLRCLEHCVQQFTQLTGLLDSVLTKCCNMVVPDALSSIEERYLGLGTLSLYFRLVQWLVRAGLLPERRPPALLHTTYCNRRLKLNRLHDKTADEDAAYKPCPLLYIDQLIENEFGGERVREMWCAGGSEWRGLYPPPSLHALLRLYLLPDVPDHHKHELVLYLLVDYSMLYDDAAYEGVIRRLMQFPTMFGLSNTAIKATQAFWHLDHRDFDFALDQLQCLTGNTLSEWQHKVVLSSLLAQKKTQAALQYVNARGSRSADWRASCDLYLARKLVFDALDVVRTCVNDAHADERLDILQYFFNGCRNTGQLAKLLQASLMPFEEEVFTKYLEDCGDQQTSDILVMYYLQQARYLEAQQYNNKIKQHKPWSREASLSCESLAEAGAECGRDALVEAACDALPDIARRVAATLDGHAFYQPPYVAPKSVPISVEAKSPKTQFTYKSTFIQDTIENASETWVNKPKTRRGIKRALDIEDTPFICTPKQSRTKSLFSVSEHSAMESTPAKRTKLESGDGGAGGTGREREIGRELAQLLDLPEPSPRADRGNAGTPHSILKSGRSVTDADGSPTSRFLDSDDELDTATDNTHYTDNTNKHLRFTIPTASEGGSTPSPIYVHASPMIERSSPMSQKEMDNSVESYVTTTSRYMEDRNLMESPPKKFASEAKAEPKKVLKDSVRARLSLSANSSLSDDPSTSIESIADLPVTLINPRYRRTRADATSATETEADRERDNARGMDAGRERERSESPRVPGGRRGIRSMENTSVINRSRSVTPERPGSPIIALVPTKHPRCRSHTPERILETRRLEAITEAITEPITESPTKIASPRVSPARRTLRRSRTPERVEKIITESPRLEAIIESPSKTESPPVSPRSLRSRSRTPEVDVEKPIMQIEAIQESPRSTRARSKTPEKLMSPKIDRTMKTKKSLSRMVLEANTFAKSKQTDNIETQSEEKIDDANVMECTPMKPSKPLPLLDVTFSPIVNKSVLQSSTVSAKVSPDSAEELKPLPAFITINETCFDKSVLVSDNSSEICNIEPKIDVTTDVTLPEFTSIQETFAGSVLHSYNSSIERSSLHEISVTSNIKSNEATEVCASVLKDVSSLITNDSDSEIRDDEIQKEKEKLVEIEREINEIEEDMSGDSEELDEEESEGSEDEDESSEEESEPSTPDDNEEIISIVDSDSDESSDSPKLQIDIQETEDNNKIDNAVELITTEKNECEQINSGNVIRDPKTNLEDISEESPVLIESQPTDEKPETKNIESIELRVDDNIVESGPGEDSTNDPLNQAGLSILTDDNSVIESDVSEIKLNYSEEKQHIVEENKEDEHVKCIAVETTVQIEKVEDSDIVSTEIPSAQEVKKDIAQIDYTAEIKIPEKEVEKTEQTIEVEPKKIEELHKVIPETTVRPDTKTAISTSVEVEEPKTPKTRKRVRSTASTTSRAEDEPPKTPESGSSHRAQTPTSTEVRRIMTRRASRELSKLDESNISIDIPKRRSSRTKSKADDASVASDTSVKSNLSKMSEGDADTKPAQVRKGRKSILTAKPELSAIPETVGEETGRGDFKDVTQEYSSSRRLTRQQRARVRSARVVPPPASSEDPPAPSVDGELEGEEGEDGSETSSTTTRSSLDLQTIDRITLLNKQDFQGTPDSEELHMRGSPDSFTSDASALTRGRLSRAASETKATPKKARSIRRRGSVDIGEQAESPARASGRRASFTRACEALHTPTKGRRSSIDVQKAEGSPARRPRKGSNSSLTNIETPKKSSKMPIIEEK